MKYRVTFKKKMHFIKGLLEIQVKQTKYLYMLLVTTSIGNIWNAVSVKKLLQVYSGGQSLVRSLPMSLEQLVSHLSRNELNNSTGLSTTEVCFLAHLLIIIVNTRMYIAWPHASTVDVLHPLCGHVLPSYVDSSNGCMAFLNAGSRW